MKTLVEQIDADLNILGEEMTPNQLDALRVEYGKINKVDPSLPTYKKISDYLDNMDQVTLKQVASADIKFLSGLARNRLKAESFSEESPKYSTFASSRRDSLGKPFQMRDYGQQMDFFAFPTEQYFHQNGVSAYLSINSYSRSQATEVHFVSGDNGDEFGQFANKADALEKARKMAALSKEERSQYDESFNEALTDDEKNKLADIAKREKQSVNDIEDFRDAHKDLGITDKPVRDLYVKSYKIELEDHQLRLKSLERSLVDAKKEKKNTVSIEAAIDHHKKEISRVTATIAKYSKNESISKSTVASYTHNGRSVKIVKEDGEYDGRKVSSFVVLVDDSNVTSINQKDGIEAAKQYANDYIDNNESLKEEFDKPPFGIDQPKYNAAISAHRNLKAVSGLRPVLGVDDKYKNFGVRYYSPEEIDQLKDKKYDVLGKDGKWYPVTVLAEDMESELRKKFKENTYYSATIRYFDKKSFKGAVFIGNDKDTFFFELNPYNSDHTTWIERGMVDEGKAVPVSIQDMYEKRVMLLLPRY